MTDGPDEFDDARRDRGPRGRHRPRPVRRQEIQLALAVAAAVIAAVATYRATRTQVNGQWVAAGLLVAVIALGLVFRWRRRRLRRICSHHGGALCTNCAYPVKGRRCPECGEPFEAARAASQWTDALRR